jgi:tRNA dimethylallyltransferase
MDLALRLKGEILSIDSRQAYRRIDIGTAKPSAEDRRLVPHHLVDVFDLHETIDAQRFSALARAAIHDAASRGALPILVGGSGLYFRAIETGFFDIALDPGERASFAESLRGVPGQTLHERLREIDPESAERIHPNDRYRIVRALEVHALTGTSLSGHMRRQRLERSREDIAFVKIGLELARGELHRRIGERARDMFDRGWAEEVRHLLAEGADPAWPGMRTLGYPEVVAFVGGRRSFDDTIERIGELTRQYAKRQATWFRKEPAMQRLAAEGQGLVESAAALVERRLAG